MTRFLWVNPGFYNNLRLKVPAFPFALIMFDLDAGRSVTKFLLRRTPAERNGGFGIEQISSFCPVLVFFGALNMVSDRVKQKGVMAVTLVDDAFHAFSSLQLSCRPFRGRRGEGECVECVR